ncbi:uroporphyrinogen-III C-methyltransferase [Polynucleobacter asymbioticus]|nr:uroporphyrinogen-III C-methyltransferase [Polynucleobacter asymbioticus]
MANLGTVYLVGAGPGAADLITVRGAKLLSQADIVLHDALIDPAMLELCPQALKVAVGKRCGKLSSAQEFINKRLVDAAHKFQTIVRLKGGDPMLFGRADEEIAALENAGIAFEIVPGITAALAGAASLQKSLTLRGIARSVAFVTLAQATDSAETHQLQTMGPIANPSADTLVYYMGRKDAAKIAMQLMESSPIYEGDTPVHILEAVSTAKERHWESTLHALAAGKAHDWFDPSSPALILIGQALARKKHLEGASSKIDDGLQDGFVLPNSRHRA